MHHSGISKRQSLRASIACSLLLCTSACGSVGPTLLRNGRGIYADAISQTDDEQLLDMIVSGRYADGTSLLSVASVTASVTLGGHSSAQFGIGDDDNYSGNLVPLDVGAVYEENPTITYIPVQGEKYLRHLMSPLSLEVTLLLMTGGNALERVFTILVKRVNGLPNDAFQSGSSEPDERFARVGQLLTSLFEAGRSTWVQDPDHGTASLLFTGYEPDFADELRELCSLLGIALPSDFGGAFTVPILLGIGRAPGEIRIDTRSVFELLQIAEAATEVPDEDVAEGFAKPYPPLGATGAGVRIRRSDSAPEDAAVAIRRGDWWYFISDADLTSKMYFRLLGSLVSLLLSESPNQSGPVLTLPVSR